jgi:hypothetical protein
MVFLHVVSTVGRGIEYYLGIETTTEFVRLFHVAEEANITSWFSSMILLLCSLLLAVIAVDKHQQKDKYKKHWSALSIIFLYLSIDEAARIHEVIGFELRDLLDTKGAFYQAWVILMIPLLLVMLVVFFRFLLDLPKSFRALFLISAFIFIFGALGMEMIGCIYRDNIHVNWKLINAISITIEEFLENVGIVIFIYALLRYIKTNLSSETVTFQVS